MEIIEKQVEKVKEVPYGYGYYDGYGRNVIGRANAGLALGIVGTVLGGAALFGNRRNGLLGVGSNGDGANIAIASCGYAGGNNVAPTAFQAWEKECEDTLALQKFHSDNRGQHKFFDRFNRMSEGMNEEDMYEMMKAMKSHYSGDEHFNESYARYLVSNMHHTENGRKYVGEKFDMTKTKEVCERYRGILAQSITHADVYVAINSHYHDYCELFKAWFGDNIDQKIIESAIIFWFKDDDYEEGSKLWNYFKEN